MKYLILYLITTTSILVNGQNRYIKNETTFGNEDSIVYVKSTMTPLTWVVLFTKEESILGRREINFKNGKFNGLNSVWYSNGQLQLEINFLNGREMVQPEVGIRMEEFKRKPYIKTTCLTE